MGDTTALTLSKMLEIEGGITSSAAVSGDNLIVTRRDGSTFDVGSVRGPQGKTGGVAVEQGYNIDLNDLTEAGTYAQSSNVEAASGFNYPVPYAGLLKVEADALSTMLFQTYTIYNGSVYSGITFVRVRDAGVWSKWDAFGSGPWTNILFTGSSTWIPYGSTWRVPQYQIQGSMVALRGLMKCYYLNDFDSDVGYGYGPIEYLPPPMKNEIFLVAADRFSTYPTVLSHNHLGRPINARVNVYRDEVSFPTPTTLVSFVATSANYFPENAYASISGIFWDWIQ